MRFELPGLIRDNDSAPLRFIHTELVTGLTLASIADESKGERKARNRASARLAYNSVLRFVERVTMTHSQSKEVYTALASLKARLEALGESF